MKNINYLKNCLNELDIKVDNKKLNQFEKYYDYLIECNKVMNLTSITDELEVIQKHFIDSIMLKNVIEINNVNSLIDVGTGAGFPGIPLKIIYPHLKITLLDSLQKRINFLNNVISLLNLEDVECIHGRAEDFGQNESYREQYDLCVSRAVSQLNILSEYTIPFIKVNGMFIAYKGSEYEEDINKGKMAIKKLGGSIKKVEKMNIIDTNIVRTYVLVEKISSTHQKYPRKAGKPNKSPL